MNTNTLNTVFSPLSRLLLSGMFIMSGFSKIGQYEQTQMYMESMGVFGGLLPLVIITEALGGLLILVGFQTRLAAFLLAGFSIVSAIFFHANFSDQTQMILFMKNFTIAGGFLSLVASGAGALSIDSFLAKRKVSP